MTYFRDIAIAPFARLTVTIIGSISGVRPTATATANSSASSQLPSVTPLITNTRGAITRMNPSINQVKRVMPLSKLVSCRALGDCSCHDAESSPRAGQYDDAAADSADDSAPHKADVGEIKSASRPRLRGPQRNPSGIASPVRVDWLMKRSLAAISLRSAGIMIRPTAERRRRAQVDRSEHRRGRHPSVGAQRWLSIPFFAIRRRIVPTDTPEGSLG